MEWYPELRHRSTRGAWFAPPLARTVFLPPPGRLLTRHLYCLHARSEEAILQEGFHRGFSEAATQLSTEVERAAGAAFARSLEQEEGARARQLAEAVAQLRKEQYRCVAVCASLAQGRPSINPSPPFRPPSPPSFLPQGAKAGARVRRGGGGGACVRGPRRVRASHTGVRAVRAGCGCIAHAAPGHAEIARAIL